MSYVLLYKIRSVHATIQQEKTILYNNKCYKVWLDFFLFEHKSDRPKIANCVCTVLNSFETSSISDRCWRDLSLQLDINLAKIVSWEPNSSDSKLFAIVWMQAIIPQALSNLYCLLHIKIGEWTILNFTWIEMKRFITSLISQYNSINLIRNLLNTLVI